MGNGAVWQSSVSGHCFNEPTKVTILNGFKPPELTRRGTAAKSRIDCVALRRGLKPRPFKTKSKLEFFSKL
jgi:hypothetical protein